ncbi:MAG: prolyl oligopeptidase family serine peptidase, partial [Lachnospiraceae bacterium]
LSRALASRHIPDLLVDLVSLTTRFWYGYSYQQMRPIDHLSDNTVPILFIHGAEDKFIVPDHSFRMAKATAGYSEVHLIHGAAHAMSAYTDPEAYRGYLKAFLDHIGVLIND